MRLVLALSSLALIACHTGLDLPITNDGGDTAGCSEWTDDSSCNAHGCATLDCSFCGGPLAFHDCYDPSGTTPSCDIGISCPDHSQCGAQTEADCVADSSCFAVYQEAACDCAGINCCPMVFESCMLGPPVCDPGPTAQPCGPAPPCDAGYAPVYPSGGGCSIGCVEAPLCDAAGDCTTLTTQSACDANPACVSIININLCNCAGPNCCPPTFGSCQNGPALCTGFSPPPPGCPVVPQDCTVPYAVAYDSEGCPLGCVNESQCGGL